MTIAWGLRKDREKRVIETQPFKKQKRVFPGRTVQQEVNRYEHKWIHLENHRETARKKRAEIPPLRVGETPGGGDPMANVTRDGVGLTAALRFRSQHFIPSCELKATTSVCYEETFLLLCV